MLQIFDGMRELQVFSSSEGQALGLMSRIWNEARLDGAN